MAKHLEDVKKILVKKMSSRTFHDHKFYIVFSVQEPWNKDPWQQLIMDSWHWSSIVDWGVYNTTGSRNIVRSWNALNVTITHSRVVQFTCTKISLGSWRIRKFRKNQKLRPFTTIFLSPRIWFSSVQSTLQMVSCRSRLRILIIQNSWASSLNLGWNLKKKSIQVCTYYNILQVW